MATADTDGKSSTPPWEAKKAPSKRGLTRRILIWVLGAGLVGLILYGLAPKPIEVELGLVKPGPLTVYVMEEGRTRIPNRYVVSAPVSGSMRRVPLKPGDAVKAGETLLTAIEPAMAPLLDVRSKAQAQARVDGATASVARAKEALEMSKTSAKFAQTNWDRVKTNATQGSISASDRDVIERETLMRDREVRSGEFGLQVAEYELAQAKAALLQMDAPSGSTGAVVEIRSPVSGRVLKVQQESATMIAAGAPILEVGDPTDLEIEAEILSRDAVTIKPGDPVSVEQWGGEQPLKARVRLVEPAGFTKISALGVEEQRVIVVSDILATKAEAGSLGDRYRVEVRVAVWHSDNLLLVPSGALYREGSEWKTFLFDNGKAKVVSVQTGHTDGKLTEVIGGLKEGDRVLMHPPDSVKDGVGVKERATPKG